LSGLASRLLKNKFREGQAPNILYASILDYTFGSASLVASARPKPLQRQQQIFGRAGNPPRHSNHNNVDLSLAGRAHQRIGLMLGNALTQAYMAARNRSLPLEIGLMFRCIILMALRAREVNSLITQS